MANLFNDFSQLFFSPNAMANLIVESQFISKKKKKMKWSHAGCVALVKSSLELGVINDDDRCVVSKQSILSVASTVYLWPFFAEPALTSELAVGHGNSNHLHLMYFNIGKN